MKCKRSLFPMASCCQESRITQHFNQMLSTWFLWPWTNGYVSTSIGPCNNNMQNVSFQHSFFKDQHRLTTNNILHGLDMCYIHPVSTSCFQNCFGAGVEDKQPSGLTWGFQHYWKHTCLGKILVGPSTLTQVQHKREGEKTCTAECLLHEDL